LEYVGHHFGQQFLAEKALLGSPLFQTARSKSLCTFVELLLHIEKKKDVLRYFDIQEYFISYDECLLKADTYDNWSAMHVGWVIGSFNM